MSSSRWSLVVVAVLVGLLAVLATLQYRWIAQLSEAEQTSLQARVDRATEEFCEDFDREIARAVDIFDLNRMVGEDDLPRVLNDRLNDWKSAAVWPEMVGELVVIRLLDTGDIALFSFDERSTTLLPSDPDDDLQPIIRHLRDRGAGVPVIDGVLPGLILAIEGRAAPGGTPPHGWQPPRDHLVIRFDRAFVTAEVLPQLADTHFRVNGEPGYLLVVSSLDRPGGVIFQTDSRGPFRIEKPDATGRLFGLRSPRELSDATSDSPRMRRPRLSGRNMERGAGGPPPNLPPPGLRARTEEGHWNLEVHHPAGSLEAVVKSARRRNMAISLATLALLGVTAVLMMLSTRRAQRLARQQVDFVAAVSHELRTPLTAIRSAGQNLADGIIDDSTRVQRYGLLIEREGRRLTEMIGRVLTFAGIRSGRQIYRMEPVQVGEVVGAALRDSGWVLGESGFEVETEIAEGLPPVNGNAVALRQVVTNLVDNALKYAAEGRWLLVRVDRDDAPGRGGVRIEVSDRGPGIPKRELQTVFEPFRRGQHAGDGGAAGSGLGLAVVRSIVEAHGGTISVDAPSGGGAVFTVRIPASPGSDAEKGGRR